MSFDMFFFSDLLNVKKSLICMTYTQLMDSSNCCKITGCLKFRIKKNIKKCYFDLPTWFTLHTEVYRPL